MKIGVSSQNFKTITGHAGKGRRFICFEVDGKGNVEETDRLDLPKTMSIHETLEASPHPLDELDVLITGSAGGGFLRKMSDRGVKVVTTSASDPLLAVMSYAAGEELPPAELDHDDRDHGHQHAGGGCCGGGGHHHHHHHDHGHSHESAGTQQYSMSDEPQGGGCCGGGGHHHHDHDHHHAPAPKRGGGGCCGGGGH